MTKGPLLPQLIGFTIPLILGNFLQLTYNAVDSIILGRFVSAGALAAAGTCNPLMTLIIMAMQGMTMGAGILIGNLYGAGRVFDSYILDEILETAKRRLFMSNRLYYFVVWCCILLYIVI